MGENSTDKAAEVQAGSSNPVPPGVPAMASYFGRMDAFNQKEKEWLTCVERLEFFFVVNNVPEDKKAASLPTLMGVYCGRHRNRWISLSGTSSINVIKKKVSPLENFLQSCKSSLKHANSEPTGMKS